MSSESKKTSELPVANSISNIDRIIIVTDPTGLPNTKSLSFLDLQKSLIKFQTPSANTICTQGTIFYDTNYLYIAVANNTIKKVALQVI